MSEPVTIDSIPVELTADQQRQWDAGDKAAVRREVRELRKNFHEGQVVTDEPEAEDYDFHFGGDDG